MLELEQLRAFIAVASSGSFSDAAKEIHLTQPAISKRVAALERYFGRKLFNRIGRDIQLTEAGTRLFTQAHALLNQAKQIDLVMSNLDDHVDGTLSIGISHHIGLHRMPPILKKYCDRYPEVELDISFIDSEQAYEAIQSGKMEIGLVTLPSTTEQPISAHQVWLDELKVVTDTKHPLQQRGTVGIEALIEHPAILPNSNTFTRHIIEKSLEANASRLNVAVETNYLETNRMLISIGLGWGLIPHTMCNESVATLSVEGLQLERSLGYVIHIKRQLSNAANAMIELLEEERTTPT